jgi:hypothetical protein
MKKLKHILKPPLNQLPNFAAHMMYYLNPNLTPEMACMHGYHLELIGLLLKEQMTWLQLHIPQHLPAMPNWMTKAWNKGDKIKLTKKLMMQYSTHYMDEWAMNLGRLTKHSEVQMLSHGMMH